MIRLAADENFNNNIEEILLIAECSVEGEWEGQLHYLPL
jgi:hypothetical protein